MGRLTGGDGAGAGVPTSKGKRPENTGSLDARRDARRDRPEGLPPHTGAFRVFPASRGLHGSKGDLEREFISRTLCRKIASHWGRVDVDGRGGQGAGRGPARKPGEVGKPAHFGSILGKRGVTETHRAPCL